ncbi:MAG: PDZ domain-containing protein [Oscillospiraceae bacterium]|nr:PDZ domain-containing protein [Oscillospiraceae bacterium]
MKKIPIGATIGLMAITAAVTFVVTGNFTLERFNEKIRSTSEKQEFYSKLSEIDNYIRTHFIGEIDETALIDGMVNGYIDGVGDPLAECITAEEYALRLESQTGVTDGLGFECEKETGGYILITEIIPGGSAEESGLLAGDIITAVNNTDVIAFAGGYDEAVSLFHCDEGTRVKLYVKRTDENGSNDFITYDVISMRSEIATVSGKNIDDIGFIRISSFTDCTSAQLKATLDELISNGAKGLIFDLRGCSFGSVEAAGECLDHILGAGDVVKAEYKSGTVETVITCTEAENLKMPMSVIVNRGTSGAAEIFALALSDSGKAHIIGKATAGRGYMQSAYTCSDGSVVMLSTAKLLTSSGTEFNGVGIRPEFDVSLGEDVDFLHLSTEAALLTDAQLIKAMEVTVVN